MRRAKVSVSFGLLFLSIFLLILLAFTPALHAQAPAAGTAVSVRMIDAVNSASDPAGKQYRVSVTKAVTAANGVVIAQGAAATVTLAGSGSGYVAQLSSISINGQAVAVASGSASITGAAQNATGSAVNAMNSVLGGFGHHVNAPSGVAAVATGQRVVLPPGTTLTFVLSQPPAANSGTPAAPGAPAAPAAQAMQASTAPASGPVAAAAAPGQHWWLCRYRVLKDANKPVLGTLMYYALFPSSDATPNNMTGHFSGYVRQNYPAPKDGTNPLQDYCERVFDDAPGRANTMDMLQKQWASSNIEAINVKWTDTPAENAAIDANVASAAAAAAVPTAAANQHYVFCNSARVEVAGAVEYFSDIFPAVTLPQQSAGGGKGGNGGDYVNAVGAFQRPFFAFLQKKYGYKDSGNYPTECAIGYPPTAGGLQQAKATKQQLQDLARQNKGQIVETGWKNQ